MKKILVVTIMMAAILPACKKKKDAEPSNQAPSVSITSPKSNVDNAKIAASATIIKAEANDADGTITKVEFYDGKTKLGTDTNAPYSLEVSLGSGTFELSAKAYDDNGATTTSEIVNYRIGIIEVPMGVK